MKMEFLSSRSVQNSNLTLETDEQKGEKKKRGGSSFHPLGKDFYVLCAATRPATAQERVRRRVEIVENDKQGESYSNRKTRSWI